MISKAINNVILSGTVMNVGKPQFSKTRVGFVSFSMRGTYGFRRDFTMPCIAYGNDLVAKLQLFGKPHSKAVVEGSLALYKDGQGANIKVVVCKRIVFFDEPSDSSKLVATYMREAFSDVKEQSPIAFDGNDDEDAISLEDDLED